MFYDFYWNLITHEEELVGYSNLLMNTLDDLMNESLYFSIIVLGNLSSVVSQILQFVNKMFVCFF